MSRRFGSFFVGLGAAFLILAGFGAHCRAEAPPSGGFAVTTVEVAAEREAPQACVVFSDRLDKSLGRDYEGFVEIEPRPPALAVVVRDNTLCVEGLSHGASYVLTLRPGLPGGSGARLKEAERRELTIPNRAPSLGFRGAGYILPHVGAEGLPLRSVNVDGARLRVLRIADRALVEKIYSGRVSQTLSDWDIGEIVEKEGKVVWSGDIPIKAARNAQVVTPFPVEKALGGLERGVYLAAAEPATGPREPRASQWFVVSELGMTSFIGDDGLTVFVRSVASAEPAAGVELHLFSRTGKELAKRVTGGDGTARFEAALSRRDGDDAAQALFAFGEGGDFSFLDLAAPSFDLGDRGSAARSAPGPLDAFVFTDRGVYRPGEVVNLTALLRDDGARAVSGRPLTFKLWRPDGFEAARRKVGEAGAGGFTVGLGLPAAALTGGWSVTVHPDEEGPAVGRTEFSVVDFVPPRLEVSLAASVPVLAPESGLSLSVEGRTLSGAPAAGLPGELSLSLRPAETPFPRYAGYQFGLVQEKLDGAPLELPGFVTEASGKAVVVIPSVKVPESSRPLEAVLRATVFDVGGRPVTRDLVLPVRHQPFAIGVRPRFDDGAVPEGATAAFDVIATGANGDPAEKRELSYELFEEDHDYRWFESGGHWDYETVIKDRRVTGGSVVATADGPARIEEPVGAGSYRLEVFDPQTGVSTSVRFAAGWWVTPNAGSEPDRVEVSVMPRRYRAGESARIHIRPPYDAEVLIAVADRSIRQLRVQKVSAQGAFLDIPVDPAWTAGATIIAAAYAPTAPASGRSPRRAIGVGWLAVDPAPHTLSVKLEAPADIEPRRTAQIGVSVRDAGGAPLAAGSAAWVTLLAVDDAVLRATEQRTPDPAAYFLGPRRFGAELRDDQGRMLPSGETGSAAAGSRPGPVERRRLRQLPGLPEREAPVAALFSGAVAVGAEGAVSIPLALPDFEGRLRLIAVAWSADAVGSAESAMTVRDRVGVSLALPRFLAPGDTASLEVVLSNPMGGAGDYQIRLGAEGATIADGLFTLSLPKRGHRAAMGRRLIADRVGSAVVSLEVTGPDGYHLSRVRTIPVRVPEQPVLRQRLGTLAAGATLEVPADLVAGLRPDAVSVAVSLGVLPDLGLPGLVMTACAQGRTAADQVASCVLRLIAGESAAATLDGDAPALRRRAQSAVDRLLALQKADGGFSAWSLKADADPALTAFLVDTLIRARTAGYEVPDSAVRLGLDWLKRMLDNGWFEDRDLPYRAYGTWLLSRAKLIDGGAVRYFLEAWGSRLPSDMAQAQLAAALAGLGDATGAQERFATLADRHKDGSGDTTEIAGIVTLGLESGALAYDKALRLAEVLTKRLASVTDGRTGAMEKAWVALAARAIADHAPSAGTVRVTEGEKLIEAPVSVVRRLPPGPGVLRNIGPVALGSSLSVVGYPVAPGAALDSGLVLTRSVFDMDGKPIHPDAIRRNDLLVVLLEGRISGVLRRLSVVITDPLPAGLEIESVRQANSPRLGALAWLGPLTASHHISHRNDRFVAALDLDDAQPSFRLVYLVRAITPGDFVHGAAMIESVADPAIFGRTAAGRVHILGDKD